LQLPHAIFLPDYRLPHAGTSRLMFVRTLGCLFQLIFQRCEHRLWLERAFVVTLLGDLVVIGGRFTILWFSLC
jgi:hypothetical protein